MHFITTFTNPFGTGIPANYYKPKVDFTTGTLPYSVAIGDVDGNGKPDLVVANRGSDNVSVFRNISATGSITASSFAAKVDFTTGTAPYSVAIGDVASRRRGLRSEKSKRRAKTKNKDIEDSPTARHSGLHSAVPGDTFLGLAFRLITVNKNPVRWPFLSAGYRMLLCNGLLFTGLS